jgi:glycosyltransferase involved in cell wall biosynthesis
MITVVHIITKLELGGAQENTLDTVRLLDRKDFQPVLIFGPGGTLDTRAQQMKNFQAEPLQRLVHPIHPKTDAICLAEMTDVLLRLKSDHERRGHPPEHFLVHTHCSKAGFVGRLAARAARVHRVVHTIHGFAFHPEQSPLRRALFVQAERLAARATHAFIGVSQSVLDEAEALRILSPNRHRAHLIRSGFDVQAFRNAAPCRAQARETLGIPADHEICLAVSNFKSQKDPLTLIRAFRLLSQNRRKAHLVWAGDGPLRPQVLAEAEASHLADRVHLLGWRHDIPELMAASDLVVLASLFEGLPRVAAQAIAARRPFVGTDVNGTSEVIRTGKNGYLVRPSDPTALATAMAKALINQPIDPDDEGRLVDWEVEHMVHQQEDLYRELLDMPN